MSTEIQDREIVAIRQVIADAERLQNDADGYLRLHADNAAIVNFGGFRVRGIDTIGERMRAALATPLADVIITVEVESVHFLRPDVAVVDAVKHVSDGRESELRAEQPLRDRGSLTYVLVKEQGKWLIALAQTTPVTE